jgi:hypothetical protein
MTKGTDGRWLGHAGLEQDQRPPQGLEIEFVAGFGWRQRVPWPLTKR